MKIVKLLLLIFLIISALLQLIWGIWILIDLKSAASIFLGAKIESLILKIPEFIITSKMLGKAFLMLSSYSLLTIYFVFKENKSGFILSITGGFIISLIAVTTFIETRSLIVIFSDLLRGVLILTFSILFYKLNNKKSIGGKQ